VSNITCHLYPVEDYLSCRGCDKLGIDGFYWGGWEEARSRRAISKCRCKGSEGVNMPRSTGKGSHSSVVQNLKNLHKAVLHRMGESTASSGRGKPIPSGEGSLSSQILRFDHTSESHSELSKSWMPQTVTRPQLSCREET
jgi:hypothetical protein